MAEKEAHMTPETMNSALSIRAGEYLITHGQHLIWLPQLPARLFAPVMYTPAAQTVPAVMLCSSAGQVCARVALYLRMPSSFASQEIGTSATGDMMTRAGQLLAGWGVQPVRASEEADVPAMPREGLCFLRRCDIPGVPSDVNALTWAALQTLLRPYSGSGMSLTLLPRAAHQEGMDFILGVWGVPECAVDSFLTSARLPLRRFTAAVTDDDLRDPWKLSALLKASGDPTQTYVTTQELTLLLGEQAQSAASEPAAGSLNVLTGGIRRSVRDMIPDLSSIRMQTRETTRAFSERVEQQVSQNIGMGLSQISGDLRKATAQLGSLPQLQGTRLMDVLDRLPHQIDALSQSQLADALREAGLDRSLDMLTLMKMGFSSEQELLNSGLDQELLSLMRSTIRLYEQCPRTSSADMNCMPYAFMLGYLYEALITRLFAPHFHRTDGNHKARYLSDYTRVDWAHCERLAAFPSYRDPAMKRFSAGDWATWLNLCSAVRMLRNRQQSDGGVAGFINREEMDAALSVLFYPGQSSKLSLLQLPAFGDEPPAWARKFQPTVPEEWPGANPADPHGSLLRHVASNVSAFTPSLLQLLMSCTAP